MLIWNDTMSVGIKKIDLQHKTFIEILDSLYVAINSRTVDEKIDTIIQSLADYTVLHFKTEERYLEKYKFPGVEEHKIEHAKLIEDVRKFLEMKPQDKIQYAFDLADFLENWLVHHLEFMDKKYAEFFKGKGIK